MTEEIEDIDSDDIEQTKIKASELDEIEAQINHLHDTLDEIKDAGKNIGTQLGMKAGEADSDQVEKYQALIQRANLLTARVEHGDRSIVRGN